jgi:hypothetical protein
MKVTKECNKCGGEGKLFNLSHVRPEKTLVEYADEARRHGRVVA